MPRRHVEAQSLQDSSSGFVGELHILEPDGAARHGNWLGTLHILDLRLARQNREHELDVGYRLLDLAIAHPHEIHRLIKLDYYGVVHHEIAYRVRAGSDAEHAQHHRGAK